ncbi:MAG: PQQ-binding-like beta-propeller repeat protein [Candidatus Hydrogenedentes bacterium]|nr:PQQ-binding-like beta-propeller repeat protein [Candidatus Hydrogenedentota bacterium]
MAIHTGVYALRRLCAACAVAVFAVVAPISVAQPPIPAAMPRTLLSTPINATWAADHADEWARRGVRGFLLDGVMDDMASDVWAVDGDAATQGNDDRLLLELRDANRRLAEKGVDCNFAAARFTTDRPYFSEPALWSFVEDRWTAAGQFCRLAEMRGIALHCQVSNLFYQYQWDGYTHTGYTAEDLGYGAAEFGKRIATAFWREDPDAEILLIADDWLDAGPLWLRMFEGMVLALGRQPTASLQLLTRSSLDTDNAEQFPALCQRATDILRARFAPENYELWKRRGGIAMGLSPLRRDRATGQARERYPIDTYRSLIAGAKVFSSNYVWIDDDDACWWNMPEEEHARYDALFQKTRRPKVSKEPPSSLAAYTATTPLDDYVRVGEYRIGDTPVYVLGSNAGASAYLWRGCASPLTITTREEAAPSTDMASGAKEKHVSEDGHVHVGPFPRPTLVERLPVREFLLPASLTCIAEDGVSSGGRSTTLRYGFVNATGFRLEGRLTALAPARMAVEPSGQDFALEPGESVTVDGALQGLAPDGAPVTVRLSLALAGSPPLTRDFTIPSAQQLLWSAKALGPIRATPLIADLDGAAGVVVCTTAGEVLCYGADGARRWRKEFQTAFALPPVLGRHWDGSPHLAVADQRGKVYVLKPDGALRWSFSFDGPCSTTGVLFANLHPFPGGELVAGLDDGRVRGVISDGFPYWTHTMPGRRALVSVLPPGPDGLSAIAAVCESGQVACLEHDGAVRWQAQADGSVDCPPLVIDFVGDGKTSSVVTVTRQGHNQVWDAGSGECQTKSSIKTDNAAIFLAYAGQSSPGALSFVVSDGAALFGLSRGFGVLWKQPVSCVSPPSVVITDKGQRILVAGEHGVLTCLDADGKTLWTDTRSAGPFAASPVVLRTEGEPALQCVFGSTDGVSRCVAVE